MPRGRRNNRKTYHIKHTKWGFRTIPDVQRRLRLIKQRVEIDEDLPPILFREVIHIFRSFGWNVSLRAIVVEENYLDDGRAKGRKFIGVRRNGSTEDISVSEWIRKSRYIN